MPKRTNRDKARDFAFRNGKKCPLCKGLQSVYVRKDNLIIECPKCEGMGKIY